MYESGDLIISKIIYLLYYNYKVNTKPIYLNFFSIFGIELKHRIKSLK